MSEVSIIATGLACAVGIGCAPGCAAMRAKIDGFVELRYHAESHAIIGAPVPVLDRGRPAIERVAALLFTAVEELAERLAAEDRASLAVIVACCGPDRPTIDEGRARWLGTLAAQALGPGPAPHVLHVFRGGSPAAVHALAFARELLAQGQIEAAIVCAADSFIDGRSLLWLAERGPLQTTGGREGTIPGEAGAALLLRSRPSSAPHLRLIGLGFGDEPAARSIAPLRGDGMTAAMRAALSEAGLGLHEIGVRVVDGAGGHREFKEHILALTRLLRARVESLPIWLVAETLGHVGTGAILVQLAWAQQALLRAYLPGPTVLATAGDHHGERAALVLRAAGAAC
jgi:3-oxoacyl-[acyl-carrier-protein] synthase I